MALEYLFVKRPKLPPKRKHKVMVSKPKLKTMFAKLGDPVEGETVPLLHSRSFAAEVAARNNRASMENTRKALSAYYGAPAKTAAQAERLYHRAFRDMNVPCAQVVSSASASPGRPSNPVNHSFEVLAAVQRTLRTLPSATRTVKAACKKLTDKKAKARYHKLTPQALEALYYKLRRKFKKERGYEYGSPEHKDASSKTLLSGNYV